MDWEYRTLGKVKTAFGKRFFFVLLIGQSRETLRSGELYHESID